MSSIRPWYREKRFLLPILLLLCIVGIVAWRWSIQQSTSTFETVAVARGNVVHTVSVTGKVEPVKSVALSFANGGTVAHVLVAVGDHVHVGQSLVSLDTDILASQLAAAQADVVREQRARVELASGARREDVAVTRASLVAAKTTYDNATNGLRRVIDRSYVVLDDAVRNKADTLFEQPTTNLPFG
jgi:HlyD family secretion protein